MAGPRARHFYFGPREGRDCHAINPDPRWMAEPRWMSEPNSAGMRRQGHGDKGAQSCSSLGRRLRVRRGFALSALGQILLSQSPDVRSARCLRLVPEDTGSVDHKPDPQQGGRVHLKRGPRYTPCPCEKLQVCGPPMQCAWGSSRAILTPVRDSPLARKWRA